MMAAMLTPTAIQVYPETFGAIGEAGTNDQPAIQAAIDYAVGIGAEVWFTKPRYELWCPVRASHAADKFNPEGHPLVVHGSVVLRGIGPTRSTLDFKGLDGVDPETNWQVVAASGSDSSNAVWRGGGLFLLGDQSDPSGDFAIDRFEIHRLIFEGNRARTGNHAYPANTTTGDGWDLTDKGFWHQDTYVGDIVMRDTDFIGWKGEVFYSAGYNPRFVDLARCKFVTSNANGLNLTAVNRRIVDCEMGDCYQAEESPAAYDARYENCLWRDCSYVALGGGPVAGLPSGYPNSWATRDETIAPPRVLIRGGVMQNAGTFLCGSWVNAELTTIDTRCTFGTTSSIYKSIDIKAKIAAWMDDGTINEPVTLGGPATLTTAVPGAPAGTYVAPPENIHVEVSCFRTQRALGAGYDWLRVTWQGIIAKSCSVTFEEGEIKSCPFSLDNPAKSFPKIVVREFIARGPNGFQREGAQLYGSDISANGAIPLLGPRMFYTIASGGTYAMTMPVLQANSYDGFVDGQRVRLFRYTGSGKLSFAKGASSTFKVPSDRLLTNQYDWIEFVWRDFNNCWEETGFFTSA